MPTRITQDQDTSNVFIFQPNGTAASSNTYTSFTSLYTDFQKVNGPKTIYFDFSSLAAPYTLDAGTYDFTDTQWILLSHYVGTTSTTITLNSTTIFTAFPSYVEGVGLLFASTGNFLSFNTNHKIVTFRNCAVTFSGISYDIFALGANATLDLYLYDNTTFNYTGGGSAIDVADLQASTSVLNIYVHSNSSIAASTIAGVASSVMNINYMDSTGNVGSQASFLGTTNTIIDAKTDNITNNSTVTGSTLTAALNALSVKSSSIDYTIVSNQGTNDTTSTTFVAYGRMIYPGSTKFTPTTMYSIINRVSGAGSVSFQVVDVSHANAIICSGSGIVSAYPNMVTTSSFSNLSATVAIWEYQISVTSTAPGTHGIFYLAVLI